MGMSTHVVGFKPPDETWQRMKAVWDACQAAGIEVPDEVDRYFDGMPPDPNGVEIEEAVLREDGILRDWTDNRSREGVEIEVSKIPADVKIVRFYNSW